MMDNEERNLLEKNLERVNFWIQNVDAKNSFLLALSGAIVGFVFTSDSFDKAITSYIDEIDKDISWGSIYAILNLILFLVSIFYIGRGMWLFLSSLKGRIDPSIWSEEELDTQSLIHFQSIAASTNYRQFKRRYDGADLDAERKASAEKNDLLSQVYINSKITTKKFILYNKGICSLVIGGACLIIFKLLSFL